MARLVSSVSCEGCGAPLSLSPGEVLITCDYCGTTFNQATDEAFVLECSIIPNTVEKGRVESVVRGWMKGGTKPASLSSGSVFVSVELSFLPFFIVQTTAKTEYKGGMTRTGGWVPREGTLEKEYFWKVLGRRASKFPTREYDIPLSTKTTFAPSRHAALAVAKNVKLGVITSSPGPTPKAISDSRSASLPDAQPTACSVVQTAAIASSNSFTSGP